MAAHPVLVTEPPDSRWRLLQSSPSQETAPPFAFRETGASFPAPPSERDWARSCCHQNPLAPHHHHAGLPQVSKRGGLLCTKGRATAGDTSFCTKVLLKVFPSWRPKQRPEITAKAAAHKMPGQGLLFPTCPAATAKQDRQGWLPARLHCTNKAHMASGTNSKRPPPFPNTPYQDQAASWTVPGSTGLQGNSTATLKLPGIVQGDSVHQIYSSAPGRLPSLVLTRRLDGNPSFLAKTSRKHHLRGVPWWLGNVFSP